MASSSSVYGLNTKTPFSEEDRVDQPASLYAATKKVSPPPPPPFPPPGSHPTPLIPGVNAYLGGRGKQGRGGLLASLCSKKGGGGGGVVPKVEETCGASLVLTKE